MHKISYRLRQNEETVERIKEFTVSNTKRKRYYYVFATNKFCFFMQIFPCVLHKFLFTATLNLNVNRIYAK